LIPPTRRQIRMPMLGVAYNVGDGAHRS
jgi:hypothetical protein